MANSDRRMYDSSGKQFLPMNVEGSGYSYTFFNTTKLVTITCILVSALLIWLWLGSEYKPIGSYIKFYALWGVISLYLTRFIVFEEKFYFRMYKQRQGNEVTTPALFWNIASIKDTEDGAILTYADARIGILVKVDRDTITGKDLDFEETHYDAISDFYKILGEKGYSFVQMNLMEPSGKDPRLKELDKISLNCQNKNIKELVELQVGHIKRIARNSLYESDYFLIYTFDITKVDTIIADTIEMMMKILDGAYIGYRVMSQRELIELDKEMFGVKYFNSTDASLNIYKGDAASQSMPFIIDSIVWKDGNSEEVQVVNDIIRNKLRRLTSEVISESNDLVETALKDAIYVKKEEIKVGVDFESLGKLPGKRNSLTDRGFKRPPRQQQKPVEKSVENKQNMRDLDLSFDDEDEDDELTF